MLIADTTELLNQIIGQSDTPFIYEKIGSHSPDQERKETFSYMAPTKEGKIPFIIGDLKEGIKFYDRRQISLLASQVASVGTGDDALNAFEEDLTLIRGIEREDAQMRDEEAFVNGYISTTPSV